MLWEIKGIISNGKNRHMYAIVPEHPKAIRKGKYVYAHRVIMENHIGRMLEDDEIVHHKNENVQDNRIENLELMKRNKHSEYHSSRRGQTVVDLKCPECKKIFTKRRGKTFLVKGGIFAACSNSCRGKFSNKIQFKGMTEDIKKSIKENVIKEYKTTPCSETGDHIGLRNLD